VSRDNGKTWTKAVETDFPDSRSKQCAGNLPDGTAFLIGNPATSKDRSVLALATAKDGSTFDHAWLIGRDPAPGRYEGKAKTPGFSYPKAIVHGEYLYVVYSINKEDIVVTRIPLAGVEWK
jgi:predicted neuraminidase